MSGSFRSGNGVYRATYLKGANQGFVFSSCRFPYHPSSSVHGERVIFFGAEGPAASLSLATLCLLFDTFGDDGLLDSGESYKCYACTKI